MDGTTDGRDRSPTPEPTSEGRARLLTALDLERARHPADSGTLGEYVELLDRDGLAAARAAFPSVAAHLAAGCDACNVEVRELREIFALDESDPDASEPFPVNTPSRRDGEIGRIATVRPPGSVGATAPAPRDAAQADADRQRRKLRVLMTGLTAVAAVAMAIMGASLYALSSLGPREGTGEIKLIARETVAPATVAPATVVTAPAPAAGAPAAPPTPAAGAAPSSPVTPGLAPAVATAAMATSGTAPASAPLAAPTAVPAASPGQPGTGRQPKPGSTGGSATPSGNDCPDSHPVKANRESGIYHLRGGAFYDRTRPESCYATPDDAERAGFRRSQR